MVDLVTNKKHEEGRQGEVFAPAQNDAIVNKKTFYRKMSFLLIISQLERLLQFVFEPQ